MTRSKDKSNFWNIKEESLWNINITSNKIISIHQISKLSLKKFRLWCNSNPCPPLEIFSSLWNIKRESFQNSMGFKPMTLSKIFSSLWIVKGELSLKNSGFCGIQTHGPTTKSFPAYEVSKEKAYEILKVRAYGISKQKAYNIMAFMGLKPITTITNLFHLTEYQKKGSKI